MLKPNKNNFEFLQKRIDPIIQISTRITKNPLPVRINRFPKQIVDHGISNVPSL